MKSLLDRRGFRFALSRLASHLARSRDKGVHRIFHDCGVWIHDTSAGYFAYHQPYIRLDMARMAKLADANFLWGYRPQPGDVIFDVGAGVGEEALNFSRAVGKRGKVICIEAHPRTYRCLETLVQYNELKNVIPFHVAVCETASGTAIIEDSNAYLSNRLGATTGIPVPATTIDAIYRRLSLGRVQFLKMNIEGAERSAIRGMSQILEQTEVMCISCHDFLANEAGEDSLRTKTTVKRFFQDNGFEIVERSEPGIPPYLRDQVWGYNNQRIRMRPAS